jgi:hypothetical protein
MTKAAATIVDACTDEALLAGWFRDLATWRLPSYARCLACRCWLVVGRRGGKSLILALTAVFLACFIDWLPYLAPGERGTATIECSKIPVPPAVGTSELRLESAKPGVDRAGRLILAACSDRSR